MVESKLTYSSLDKTIKTENISNNIIKDILLQELEKCSDYISSELKIYRWNNYAFKLMIGYDPMSQKYSAIANFYIDTMSSIVPVLWQIRSDVSPYNFLVEDFNTIGDEIQAAIRGTFLKRPKKITLILEPWLGSHFVHECFGHSSEADNFLDYAKSNGVDLGYRWSHLDLNVFDDPTIRGHNGSYEKDDEGEPAFKTHIIKNGVWHDLLHSQKTRSLLGVKNSCNGRRTDFCSPVLPRMSTTYMSAGLSTFEELLSGVKEGLFCRGAWGGLSIGLNFVIRPSYGVIIKDGKLTNKFIRRFDIKGNKFEISKKIKGIGDKMKIFDPVFGCDKGGQNNLKVTQGSPHILLEDVEVYPID